MGLRELGDAQWNKSWTIFYWAWWIAWSPFVGAFIARISRGRSVREFVLGVLLVPTLVSALWFSVFGGTALHMDRVEPGIVGSVQGNLAIGIYALLERLPFAEIASLLAAAVVAIFFVTSSDSGSFVVDMLTSGGHPNPPVWQRVFWAVSEGLVAGALLVAGRVGCPPVGRHQHGPAFLSGPAGGLCGARTGSLAGGSGRVQHGGAGMSRSARLRSTPCGIRPCQRWPGR